MGLTLSESHSTKLEMSLTNFVVTQMQTEGSTFYRAEAVGAAEGSGSANKRSAEPGDSQSERPKAKAKVKGKAKASNKRAEPEAQVQEEQDETAAGTDSPVLPW